MPRGSQTFFIKGWFGRARIPQISGKYPAAVDTKCANLASAYRACDCASLSALNREENSASGASCHWAPRPGIESRLTRLGDRI
jgi:hypothetical protein